MPALAWARWAAGATTYSDTGVPWTVDGQVADHDRRRERLAFVAADWVAAALGGGARIAGSAVARAVQRRGASFSSDLRMSSVH